MKEKRKKILSVLFFSIIIVIAGLGIVFGLPVYREYRERKAEEERRSQEPYYTEFHLTREQMYAMWNYYGIGTTPKYYFSTHSYDEEWPDYSYFEMVPSERAEKMAVVLTYRMFVAPETENEEKAGKLASENGLSAGNPMTAEWIMEHPAEAFEILRIANSPYNFYDRICSMVDDVYDEIMGTQGE